MRCQEAKRGHLGKISLCLYKGIAKGISQVAGLKNRFDSLLICTAAHFRMLWKVVNLHDFKRKKRLDKFREPKRIHISTHCYYKPTSPGSGSFPLQDPGAVF